MELAARAVEGLIFCAEETLNIQHAPADDRATARRIACLDLDPDRIPLSALPSVVERFATRPFAEYAEYCVRHYSIGQHLRVAGQLLAATQDGKNRFRLMEADDGLRRVYERDQPPGVSVGADRLASSLDLLVESGLLTRGERRFHVAPSAANHLG